MVYTVIVKSLLHCWDNFEQNAVILVWCWGLISNTPIIDRHLSIDQNGPRPGQKSNKNEPFSSAFGCRIIQVNGKHVRSVYVKDVGQCLVSQDVYEAIGYEKKDGVKAIQRLVPEKYKIQSGNTQVDLEEGVDNSVFTQPNTTLLKESGVYCFLLHCKTPNTDPFMERAVETVLPREVWKLASAIKEKDNQIQALEFTNEKYQQKIFRLNKVIS